MKTKLINGVRFELTQAEIDDRQSEIDSYIEPAPRSVTMAQARLALLDQGLLADVETALNELPEPPRTSALIEWEFQTIVHRDRDLVLTIMSLLGLDDTQIDNLFILAKTL